MNQKNAVDFEKYKALWRNSPRVIGPMADSFRDYALGVRRPQKSPLTEDDPKLFHNHPELLEFRDVYLRHCGTFKHHFVSNIPYSYQQDCSMGVAFTKYLLDEYQKKDSPVSLWTIGNSEGVVARSVAHFGEGSIHTVNNVETKENEVDFNKRRPKNAHFLGEPFCDITHEWLSNLRPVVPKKFSIIHENLSFQMIQNNRRDQLAYVSQFLEDDGIFTAYEKCTIPENPEEYSHREKIKDELFRARYLGDQGISYDAKLVSIMKNGQVSFEYLVDEVSAIYPHVAAIWNSCNFYVIVSSKNPENVRRFCNMFYAPYLPSEYRFLDVKNKPLKLKGLNGIDLQYCQL